MISAACRKCIFAFSRFRGARKNQGDQWFFVGVGQLKMLEVSDVQGGIVSIYRVTGLPCEGFPAILLHVCGQLSIAYTRRARRER